MRGRDVNAGRASAKFVGDDLDEVKSTMHGIPSFSIESLLRVRAEDIQADGDS